MGKHLQRLPRFYEYSLINGDHQFSARKIYILGSPIDLAEKFQNCEKETYKPQHLTCRLAVIVARQIITQGDQVVFLKLTIIRCITIEFVEFRRNPRDDKDEQIVSIFSVECPLVYKLARTSNEST